MAKNYRVDFEVIKARADFRAILAHYGLKPGRGVQFKILCPFHDDTEPSCSINTDERIFNCFGCGFGTGSGSGFGAASAGAETSRQKLAAPKSPSVTAVDGLAVRRKRTFPHADLVPLFFSFE